MRKENVPRKAIGSDGFLMLMEMLIVVAVILMVLPFVLKRMGWS